MDWVLRGKDEAHFSISKSTFQPNKSGRAAAFDATTNLFIAERADSMSQVSWFILQRPAITLTGGRNGKLTTMQSTVTAVNILSPSK